MAELNDQAGRYRCAGCDQPYPVDPGACGVCGLEDFHRTGEPDASAGSTDRQSAEHLAPAHDIGTPFGACPAADCGQPVSDGQTACDYCGTDLGSAPRSESDSSAGGFPILETMDGTRIPLSGAGEVVLGRSPDASRWAGVVQGHSGVSRRHAGITVEGNTVRVRDLGSSNGTWINGIRIDGVAVVPIADGTTIGLGQRYTLRVRT